VELAREKGFAVTEDELAEASRTVQDAPFGMLDDERLHAVTGGFGEDGSSILNTSFQ